MGVAYGEYFGNSQSEGLAVLFGVLTLFVGLLVSVQAANSIVSERIGQTFEILLTTPLSAREIVRQKEKALWRLILVAAVPLLTVVGTEAWAEADATATLRNGSWHWYVACAVLMIVIYLPLITWLSLWISLRVRTRFQAIIGAVGTLALWTALSPLLFEIVGNPRYDTNRKLLVFLSPASMGYLNEVADLRRYMGPDSYSEAVYPWEIVVANAAFYAVIALLIRWRLFANADRLLRR
jgi:hypothetical protein